MIGDLCKDILTNIDEGIYFVDTNRKILFWNKGAERITGFKADEVVGSHCYDNILNHIDQNGKQLCLLGCPLQATIEDGNNRKASVFLHHKKGHRVPVTVRTVQVVENGEVVGAAELFTDDSEYFDITNQLEEITLMALHDQLTGVPNRRYLESFLTTRINEYKALGLKFGVIFIDIDFFKKVNDTYGHATGDRVLQMVADTMKDGLRTSDLLARNGGEEFVAVLHVQEEEKLKQMAEKLRILVSHSAIREEGQTVKVTISLGCTMVKEDDDIQSILDRSDRLMYASKTHGRNQVTLG